MAWIANDPEGGPYLTWSETAAQNYPNPIPLYTAQPADAGMREAYSALCLPRESQASDNLDGALYHIERLSAQGKPTDDICIRTLKRVLKQIVRAEQALTAPGATTKSDGCGQDAPAKCSALGASPTDTSCAAEPEVAPGPSDPSSTRNDVTVDDCARKCADELVLLTEIAQRVASRTGNTFVMDRQKVASMIAGHFGALLETRGDVTMDESADFIDDLDVLAVAVRSDDDGAAELACALLDQFEIRRK